MNELMLPPTGFHFDILSVMHLCVILILISMIACDMHIQMVKPKRQDKLFINLNLITIVFLIINLYYNPSTIFKLIIVGMIAICIHSIYCISKSKEKV